MTSSLYCVFSQFRFSTWVDWVLMAIGVIAAIAHGVSLPVLMVVFGETVDVFANEYISREVARSFNNDSVPVDNVNCAQLNALCSMENYTDVCGFFEEDSLCTTGDDLIDEINQLVIYYCVLGVVAFVCGWLHVSLFQYACERQLNIIRKIFFHSIVGQEIGWFDVNSVGELNSRIHE